MERNTKKLCNLLESPDNMRRCAGAIALAETAPKDAAVVKALGEALQSANHTLTPYLLDALESIGSRKAVPYVMPLLQAEDLAIKVRAIAILSKAGSNLVPEIKVQLEQASPRNKVVLVDLLARIHTRDAFAAILQLLLDPKFDVAREACEAVHRHIPELPPKERTVLHKQVTTFMNSPKIMQHERALTSCLLMLGYIGRPEARSVLLKHAKPKISPYVRQHSLLALKHLDLSPAVAASVRRQVLDYLKEDDFNIVRNALDVLAQLPAPNASATEALTLLKNKHPRVRAFGAEQIAEHDTVPNNRKLLKLLEHEDPQVSEIAARALSHHEKATAVITEALRAESDASAAWRLAKILKPHSERINARSRKVLEQLAARDLQAGRPRYEALLYCLRNINPASADAVLRQVGLKHKQAKKWGLAVDCLRRLIQSDGFDEETRYELSICNLKFSPKEMARQVRQADHALRGFQALIRSVSFKLPERLRKERILDANDLYYVGFHFGEGDPREKLFGEALLQHVAKKWPSTKAGKAARSKLKLVKPSKNTAATPKETVKKSKSKKTPKRKSTRKASSKKTTTRKKVAKNKKTVVKKTTAKKRATKNRGGRK